MRANKKGREKELTKKLYTEKAKHEWKRLIKDEFHRLEFDTTLHFLKKYLPKKGLILDAGGGPGRYTIELAKKGYDVVLLDITPANLELAKKQIKKAKVQNKVKAIIEGSITKLPFKTNTFDAVLCLGGPLSHVTPDRDRKKAVNELIRVAKKKAPAFVSVMGRLSVIIDSPRRFPHEIKMTKHFKEYALEGDDYMWHGGKAYAHFFLMEELDRLFNKKKVKIIEKIGLEGLASSSGKIIDKVFKDETIKRNWLDMHYKLCTHPSVVNISQHMLIIARKLR